MRTNENQSYIFKLLTKNTQLNIGLSLLVILLAIVMRLTLSFYSIENLPPSSDEALSMLLAESIAEGKSYPLLFTGQPYQFPVEAYILSTYVESLNHTALGARFQLFVFGFVTFFGYVYICFRIFKDGQRWPVLLLILFPPSYLLLHQSGQLVPQYSITALFAVLIFILAIKISSTPKKEYVLTFIFGVISGISLSNHLLIISVVIGAASIVLATGKLRADLARIPFLILGGITGLLPMILAIVTIPGSYTAISSRIDWSVFIGRIYDTVILHSLPGAFGINPPFYADYPVHLLKSITAAKTFLIVFCILLLVAVFFRLITHFNTIIQKKWINLSWPDMFIIITILSILLMAMNIGAGSRDHRYLLPAVWSFPFLVGYVFSSLSNRLRVIPGFIVITIALINLATSATIIQTWRKPNVIQEYSGIPDITNISSWMESNGINYCYGTFWLAYRFVYESNGNIVCGPIYNERFKGWPIPYKQQVDDKENVAFIMSDTYGTKFSANKFEPILKKFGISYDKLPFGSLILYHNFKYPPALNENILSKDQYSITSGTASNNLERLGDNNTRLSVSFDRNQSEGQYIDFIFNESKNIQRIDLVYPIRETKPAKSVMVYGMADGKWKPLLAAPRIFIKDKLRFDNKHPIFGENLQTIRFDPALVDSVRVMIVSPNASSPWTLSEIRIGTKI